MHEVIEDFYDLTDSKAVKGGNAYYLYRKGERFPRKGVKVSPERIEQLATENNRMGRPMIREISVPMAEDSVRGAEMPLESLETEKAIENTPKKRKARKKAVSE
jgi:hypothetical protein